MTGVQTCALPICYVFPQPQTVNIKNSEAAGSWWRINKQSDSPKEEVALDVFKIWLNHGVRPSDETYQYIVVPATTLEKIENNTSENNIEIISNTPVVQAVKNKQLGIVQAVFYEAGELQISDDLMLKSDNPGIIMLKTEGETIQEITVADPARQLAKFHIAVSLKVDSSGEIFKTFHDNDSQMTFIAIDLPRGNYTGDSVTIEL